VAQPRPKNLKTQAVFREMPDSSQWVGVKFGAGELLLQSSPLQQSAATVAPNDHRVCRVTSNAPVPLVAE